MDGVETVLAERAFARLFIECLGWDRLRATVASARCDRILGLTAMTKKRGFRVCHRPAHRTIRTPSPQRRSCTALCRRRIGRESSGH